MINQEKAVAAMVARWTFLVFFHIHPVMLKRVKTV